MNWYHVKLVSKDPAGRKFYIKAESESKVRDRAEQLFEELEILSLDIHTTAVENDIPTDLKEPSTTNIAFDENGNRLEWDQN